MGLRIDYGWGLGQGAWAEGHWWGGGGVEWGLERQKIFSKFFRTDSFSEKFAYAVFNNKFSVKFSNFEFFSKSLQFFRFCENTQPSKMFFFRVCIDMSTPPRRSYLKNYFLPTPVIWTHRRCPVFVHQSFGVALFDVKFAHTASSQLTYPSTNGSLAPLNIFLFLLPYPESTFHEIFS